MMAYLKVYDGEIFLLSMTGTAGTTDIDTQIKEAKRKLDHERNTLATMEGENEPDQDEIQLQENAVGAANTAYKYLLEEKTRLYQQALADYKNQQFVYQQQQQQLQQPQQMQQQQQLQQQQQQQTHTLNIHASI